MLDLRAYASGMGESQGAQDLRAGIAAIAIIITIGGVLVMFAVGAISTFEVVTAAVLFAVCAPFIIRSRMRQAAEGRARRAAALSTPPRPESRLG